MFGYRRHSFKRAMVLLSAIRANRNDLKRLLCLQELLISEITLAEKRIHEAKERARSEDEGESRFFGTRAQALRKSIYYWKMFGDAIAFLYLDRFALKSVYYNIHNLDPRQDAGFVTGAVGFERELDGVRRLIHAGCPCVLTDLTNTIRYGDICLLHGPDPHLIEVKSSKVKSRRASRQRRNLRRLREFYEADRLDGFRGLSRVGRLTTHIERKSFEAELNQCINAAYDRGYGLVSPEEGIHYVAVVKTATPLSDVFRQVKADHPWAFFLNTWKSEQSWAPYYPFTLLIEADRALYDFILGRLFIVVILDTGAMKRAVSEMGYVPEIVRESPYPLRAKATDLEGGVGISQHLIFRAVLEAMSLKWIVQSALESFERADWSGSESMLIDDWNRAGFPGGPVSWGDGVHGKSESV